MKTELIRKSWPKIRVVQIRGRKFYRVDARKTGTNGRQETFKNQKEAETRATEIEQQFNGNGTEGLAFPAELRGMALTATKLLDPYGKTILQAAEFYKAHLEAEKKRLGSATVTELAQQWYHDKKSNKTKHLRATTLKGIKETSEMLKVVFAGKHILDITLVSVQTYLDGLQVGLRRKFNRRTGPHCRLDFPDGVNFTGTTLLREGKAIGDFSVHDAATRRRGFLIDGDDFLPYPFADRLRDSESRPTAP